MRTSRVTTTTATGSGAAAFELFPVSTAARSIRLIEIGVTLVNATASKYALGRPAAIGVTPTTPATLLSPIGAPSSDVVGRTAVAWGTPPTSPAAFFRQASLPATVGAFVIWTFPQGITIPVGGSIILWTLTTVSVADVYVEVEQ